MLISKNFLTREASYKPSYLISWNQSGPEGTMVDLVRMQNSKALKHGAKIAFGGRFTRVGPHAPCQMTRPGHALGHTTTTGRSTKRRAVWSVACGDNAGLFRLDFRNDASHDLLSLCCPSAAHSLALTTRTGQGA